MTTGTIKKAKLTATSTENFYDVESSNGYDHYPLCFVGPRQVICGCPAGEAGRVCYHRTFALETLVYIFPDAAYRFQLLEEGLREINEALGIETMERIEAAAEREAYEDLFGKEAA